MGYTGGTKPNPTYDSVCRGDGHTEAMKVEFDPSVISYEALMQKFFAEAGAGGDTRCRVPLPVARARVGRTTRAPLSACEAAE